MSHVAAGRHARQELQGTPGPRPPYIIGPTVAGVAGNLALGATRTVVPLVAEAEVAFGVGAVYAYGYGYAAAGAALTTAAAYTPVVGAAAYGGFIVGGTVGHAVEAHYGKEAGVAAGTLAGAASGALLGAAIGSVVPGVGTAAGAIVGGLVGGVAGWIGAYW